MSRIVLVLFLTGCATSGEPRRFPSAEELRHLSETAAPEKVHANAEHDVDSWTLAGPLPDRIETAAHGASGPWETLLEEARPGFASEAMHCVAREAGRFYLAHHAVPAVELRGFLANRCGSPSANVLVSFSSGTVPAALSDDQLFQQWRPTVEKWLQQQLGQRRLDAGLWFGRENGQGVVMLALQRRVVLLEPIPFRAREDGQVVLTGELLVPTANLQAEITQGRFGWSSCSVDPTVKPPRFAVVCRVDPNDESARIEVGAFAAGRIMGPTVVDSSLWRDPGLVWRKRAQSLTTPSGEPADALVSLVNDVRRQASLPPLALAAAECRTAAGVVRHFFAASLGLETETIADQVVLGLRAGWDVEGRVRLGHFASAMVASRNLAELVSALLDRPSGRETLLAPAAHWLAVGAFSESDQLLGAVLSSYELFDDQELSVERLLSRLAQARSGRSAPVIVKDLQGDAGEVAHQIARGRSPRSALQSGLETVAELHHGSVHGWTVDLTDKIEFPPELLQAPSLRLAVAVVAYKPPGEPWTRCVAVIISLDDTLA